MNKVVIDLLNNVIEMTDDNQNSLKSDLIKLLPCYCVSNVELYSIKQVIEKIFDLFYTFECTHNSKSSSYGKIYSEFLEKKFNKFVNVKNNNKYRDKYRNVLKVIKTEDGFTIENLMETTRLGICSSCSFQENKEGVSDHNFNLYIQNNKWFDYMLNNLDEVKEYYDIDGRVSKIICLILSYLIVERCRL